MICKSTKNNDTLIESVEPAFSVGARMRGLLGRKTLPPGSAMHIKPCGSIHTLWMRFTLDLIFLDRDYTVVKVVRNVAPFNLATGGRKAASVLEFASGWFDWNKLSVGDKLEIVESKK